MRDLSLRMLVVGCVMGAVAGCTSPVWPAQPDSDTFPDAATTGVPAGSVLRATGPITVEQDGAVIEHLEVHGDIDVKADNVTIRDTKVVGGRIEAHAGENTGTLVENVEIDGSRPDGSQAVDGFTSGIGGDNFTCIRCHIHHVGHGANVGDNVRIEDSYIHDVVYTSANGGSHNFSVGSNGGSHIVIRGNTLRLQDTPGSSGALALYGDFAPIHDVLVEHNWIEGGAYCTYGGSLPDKPYPNATGVRYLNNAFGRTYYPACGAYGPVTAFDPAGAGNLWSGNYWFDTGKPVSFER